jgi:hypothetical protein
MKRKVAAVVFLLAAIATVGVFIVRKGPAGPPVRVTLRLTVSPKDQVDFVLGQATSAKLKYEVGKRAGMRPASAQRVVAQVAPGTAIVSIQAAVETKDQARSFVEAFLELLQLRCAPRAGVAGLDQVIQ